MLETGWPVFRTASMSKPCGDVYPTASKMFLSAQMTSGQIITTSAEVTLNGGLVRESPQNPLNSGLGIIVICPDDIGFGKK